MYILFLFCLWKGVLQLGLLFAFFGRRHFCHTNHTHVVSGVSLGFNPILPGNAGQNLWQKLGNLAGLSTILNILLPSNIIPFPLLPPSPPSPNINVEVIVHSQTNISRTTLKVGEGVVLKSHSFYSRIHSLISLPNYFVLHCGLLELDGPRRGIYFTLLTRMFLS